MPCYEDLDLIIFGCIMSDMKTDMLLSSTRQQGSKTVCNFIDGQQGSEEVIEQQQRSTEIRNSGKK